MSPDEREISLVASITNAEELNAVRSLGVSGDDFTIEACRRLWTYFGECEMGERKFPSLADKRRLWNLEIPDDHPTDYHELGKALKRASHANVIRNVVVSRVQMIEENPEGAATEIVNELSRIHSPNARARSLIGTREERLEELERRAALLKSGQFIGWPTGLPILQPYNVGILPSQFITIVGRTNIGKSWLLAYMCVIAYRAGANVLFLSPEMSSAETEMRIDTLLMGCDGIDIRLEALESGDRTYLDRYRSWLTSSPKFINQWTTIDADESGGFTASSIFELVSKYRPDILAIDGFHLLGGRRRGAQGWEMIKENADAIKALVNLYGTSILNVTQAKREIGEFDMPDLEDTAYGYGLIQASDVVIGVGGVQDFPMRRRVQVPKKRGGKRPQHTVFLDWDVDRGKIRQISSEEAGGDDEF